MPQPYGYPANIIVYWSDALKGSPGVYETFYGSTSHRADDELNLYFDGMQEAHNHRGARHDGSGGAWLINVISSRVVHVVAMAELRSSTRPRIALT